MTSSLALRAERAQLTAQAKELLDKVESERRNLTAAEAQKFDEIMRNVNDLAEKVNIIELEDGRPASYQLKQYWTPAECHQAVIDGKRTQPAKAGGLPQAAGDDYGPVRNIGEVRMVKHDEKLSTGHTNLSLGKVIRGAITGNWQNAAEEQRAMAQHTDTLGGFLVPHPLSTRVIDLARNQARVFQAGALTVPMDSASLTLAKVDGGPTAHWKVENAPIPASTMTFGALVLRVQTLAALVSASVELIEDAANTPDLIENALSQALALELDRAALRGDGAAQPIGIRNWIAHGVQVIDLGTNGAALTNYVRFSEAVQRITERNGPSDGLAAIYAPRTAGTLDRFVDTTNQPLNPPESYAKLRRLVTNQVPVDLRKGTATNASEIYIGDFKHCLVGMRTQLTLEASREAGDASGSAFRNLQVWIRCYLRADVVLAQPDHFVVIDGVIP